jgi:Fic family protein
MDIERLRVSPVGTLVAIQGTDARWGVFNYWAFQAHPLPRSLPLREATATALVDAGIALGRIDVAAERLPNPWLLVRPVLRREAQSTSALEGTYASLTDVLESDITSPEAMSPETREVLNYVTAAENGVSALASRPIGTNLLAELQATIVTRTRGDTYDAGRLRERQVFVGPKDKPIQEARFVPSRPGDDLNDGMAEWEKWIHAEGEMHILVRVTLGHYQFETLHPFSDGNGRLGRLVMTLQLIEAGVLKHPLLNIAEWLEPRKDEYQGRLLDTSITGDFDSWITFLCQGIKDAADNVVAQVDRLIVARDEILQTVLNAGSRRGGATYRIADELIGYPIMDVPSVADRQEVSYQAASKALGRLKKLGVLDELRRSGRTRRVFLAPKILNEIER